MKDVQEDGSRLEVCLEFESVVLDAERGDASAQHVLGVLHLIAGEDGCDGKAAEWFRRAAAQGHEGAVKAFAGIEKKELLACAEGVGAADAAYMVVDISEGPDADRYPVVYLRKAPKGGWTEGYKTTKIVLRRIPAGTFTMGSPEDERGRKAEETQHKVTLTKDYWMGVFEMTQRQYELLMGENPSALRGDTRPVEYVGYDAVLGESGPFAKLREKTGLAFTLPTEAQWERACRAGTATAPNDDSVLVKWDSSEDSFKDDEDSGILSAADFFKDDEDSAILSAEDFFKDDEDEDEETAGESARLSLLGRYARNMDDRKGGYGEHTAVGSYEPNAWGLYDMHGNVCEWCLDWYADDLGPDAVTDPAGPDSGRVRVTRGGCFFDGADCCRSASRGYSDPGEGDPSIGFRLACPAG